jgi:tetratricopeptide (TPR) repeat protein
VVKTPALDRIATRRVFSTLALPGTLWGFLVLALPFHAALWTHWKTQWYVRAGLIASAAMLLTTGFLTRSFGFLVGLFTLGAAWAFLRHRRLVWNRLTATLLIFGVLLALAGGYFYSVRSGVIEGANPFALRLKNWISAWSIFAANPMGTGLNTYGVVYPRYMLPAANETQYTHNTPLQLLSELGFPILICAAALLLLAQRARSRGEYRSLSPYLLLALSVWLVHNLIDINVYFPSVGVVGAVLLAVLLRQPETAPQPPAMPVLVLTILASAGIVVFSALAMVSTELQFRAQGEFQENKFQAAADTLDFAKLLMPMNSSLFHDSGEVNLNLYQRRDDPKYLVAATEAFRRAIALSPEKAGSYTGLSLCLASANQVESALEEIRTAQRLYPDSTNIHAIAKLLEQRRAGIPIKQR